jgi:hypothetical protein
MFQGHFAENVKITKLYQGAANAVACDIVDMSNFAKGAFVVIHTGSSDTDLVLSLYEATSVGGSTASAITTACPIYVDLDMGTSSDTLAATTAAYSWTVDTGTYPNQMAVIEIDPSILSQGYPCVYLSDSGGNASNTCTIFFLGVPNVKGQTLPSAIA